MKKFIALITCLVLVFSFVACGKTAPEEETKAAKTTVAATEETKAEKPTEKPTSVPLNVPEIRLSVPKSLNVWTKGEKITYKPKDQKTGACTAAVNDSKGKGDTFSVSDADITAETIEDMKKKDSCIEFVYDKDQKNAFTGDSIVYDTVVIATSGDYIDIICFLKDGEVVGKTAVKQGKGNEKSLSERVLSSVEIVEVKHEH